MKVCKPDTCFSKSTLCWVGEGTAATCQFESQNVGIKGTEHTVRCLMRYQ